MIRYVTIEVVHEGPVAFSVITNGVDIVLRVVEEAAQDTWRDLVEKFQLSPEAAQLVSERIHVEAQDALWLERVEPGSSKFHGFLKPVITGALASLISAGTFNIVKDTQVWNDVKEAAVHRIDESYARMIDRLNEPRGNQSPVDAPIVKGAIIGDRMRFTFVPKPKQLEPKGNP